MAYSFLVLLFLNTNLYNDTLLLPVKNGELIEMTSNDHPYGLGILISPSSDFNIRSCTDGVVLKISKIDIDYTYQIAIKSKNIIFFYSMMDTVFVKTNEKIKKGEVIGFKNKYFI